MAEKIDNDDVGSFILDFMYGERGRGWPKVAIGLSKVDINWTVSSRSETDKIKRSSLSKVYRTTDNHTHAESQFLDSLRNIILEKDKKIIQMNAELVQNYSPCSDCASKFVEFIENTKKKDINFVLTIKFSNFYKCYYTQLNDSWKYLSPSKENIDGLVNLRRNDVALRLLEGERGWKEFLNDEFCGNITEENKTYAFKRATSQKRIEREKVDKIILQYIENKVSGK